MINYIECFLAITCSLYLCKLLGLQQQTQQVFALSKQSIQVIRDEKMEDIEKEKWLQQNSKLFALLFLKIASLMLFAFTLPLLALFLLDYFSILSLKQVAAISLSWPILGATLVLILFFFITGQGK